MHGVVLRWKRLSIASRSAPLETPKATIIKVMAIEVVTSKVVIPLMSRKPSPLSDENISPTSTPSKVSEKPTRSAVTISGSTDGMRIAVATCQAGKTQRPRCLDVDRLDGAHGAHGDEDHRDHAMHHPEGDLGGKAEAEDGEHDRVERHLRDQV